ncbi:D-3-phosphoglycerate dehydrogenase 2, partial [Hortaea werneckii]
MPSPAIGIPDRTNGQADGLNRTVSNSYNDLATSPNASFQSPPGSFGGRLAASAKSLKPFHTQDIKVLLLENVNKTGQDILKKQGYQIEILKSSLPENELIEKIQDVHVIGIRSKTQLTANVLKHAKNLIVIGCFCIGTNQVDLKYAAENGIAVFNSPFSNSRSVAEQMIGEIISLARQIGDRNNELHQGVWNKVSAGCWEVRGKTLGIVGYGHVGSQLSVLAEAMGMRVIYYDVVNLMSLGTSNQVPSLDALLQQADFVTLHVPELPETINMISSKQFEQMKNGSYLLNASRGTVVDIPALIKASQAGKLAGAALDV